MILKIELDPKLVWRLDEVAERRGVSAAELAAEVVEKAFVQRPSKLALAGERTRAEVARLHAEGLTDVEIAERIGRVQEHVARTRRVLGLKPNRRRRVLVSR